MKTTSPFISFEEWKLQESIKEKMSTPYEHEDKIDPGIAHLINSGKTNIAIQNGSLTVSQIVEHFKEVSQSLEKRGQQKVINNILIYESDNESDLK